MATKSKFETIDKGTQHFETELAQISDMSDCMRKLNAQKSLDGVREMLEIPKSSATFVSPVLDGVPEAPTAEPGTNSSQVATTAFVAEAVSELLGSAPETLDTIQELSDALGNDPNFSTTIMELVGEKLPLSGGTVTGDLKVEGEASASSFKGSLTGDVTGNVTGSLKGNADTATLAAEATKLATARTIDGIEFNGEGAIQHFGVCSTAAESKEKVVTCVGYKLATGSRIEVKFSTTNTATEPTLNVNNTGAKPVFYRGAAIGAGNLAANRVYSFVYNGAQYELIGDINTDTNTAMTQNVSTANASYPVLLTPAANATVNQGAKTGIFAAGVRVNPSTKSLETDGYIVCNSTDSNGSGLIIKGEPNSSTHEGGQICLEAPPGENNVNGLYLDNLNGVFRIFGKASADGKTKTGYGNFFYVDPYSKKVSGGYTFEGNVTGSSGSCTGNAATATTASNSNKLGGLPLAPDGKGNVFGTIPKIHTDGVTELGKYIDFHSTTDATKDYDVRLTAAANLLTSSSPITAPTFNGALNGNAATATKATQDKNGHDITTTYLSLAGGTMTGNLVTKNTPVTKGTNPTAVQYRSLAFTDNTGSAVKDRLGILENKVNTNGITETYISAYNYTKDNTTSGRIAVLNNKGTVYTEAPTPADNDNTTKIATTAWVQKFCNTTKKFLTAHQSLANYLPLTGGTVTGTLTLTRNTDANGKADNAPALIVGGARTAAHLEMDANELIAKSNGTTPTELWLNGDGGQVHIGAGGLKVDGTITGNVTGNVTGSSGSCTGKAATAGTADTAKACTGNAATATVINRAPTGTSYVAGAKAGQALISSTTTGFGAVWNGPTKNYRVACSTYPGGNEDLIRWYSVTNANCNANTNTVTKQMTWNAANGYLTTDRFVGYLQGNCSGSSSSCTGNAATATKINGKTIAYVESFNATTGELKLKSLS